jgi:hypothetical protein
MKYREYARAMSGRSEDGVGRLASPDSNLRVLKMQLLLSCPALDVPKVSNLAAALLRRRPGLRAAAPTGDGGVHVADLGLKKDRMVFCFGGGGDDD